MVIEYYAGLNGEKIYVNDLIHLKFKGGLWTVKKIDIINFELKVGYKHHDNSNFWVGYEDVKMKHDNLKGIMNKM